MSAELLDLLLSFPSNTPQPKTGLEYHIAARHFVTQVTNVSAQQLLKGADTPQDILELLNPAVNTIAYIFALQARLLAAAEAIWYGRRAVPDEFKPGGAVWNKICLFFETADPVQLRYVGAEWRKVIDTVEQLARVLGTPALAIAPIRSAMLRLDPTTGTFTTVHLQFMRLCMETRSYTAALPILDNPVHSLPSNIPAPVHTLEYSVPAMENINSGEYIHSRSGHSEKVTLQAVQEYYVLGAMAYIGLRQYKKAKNLLEHVLVVPTTNGAANGLMLEAYKKWVLVSCLAEGAFKSTPRAGSAVTMKMIKQASKAYDALVDAFMQPSDMAKLKAQINAGRDTWAEDGNTGLVNQLVEHQTRFAISRLSRTYSAIPISHISRLLRSSDEDLLAYLETLIGEGHLNAQLERSNKAELGVVLRFFLDPTQGPLAKTEKQQQQTLQEQARRINTLTERIRSTDYLLSISKEHVEHVKRMNKKAAANMGEAMDTSWDDGVMDEEDLMGDAH